MNVNCWLLEAIFENEARSLLQSMMDMDDTPRVIAIWDGRMP